MRKESVKQSRILKEEKKKRKQRAKLKERNLRLKHAVMKRMKEDEEQAREARESESTKEPTFEFHAHMGES